MERNFTTNPIKYFRDENIDARKAMEGLKMFLKKISKSSSPDERKVAMNDFAGVMPAIDRYVSVQFRKEEDALFPVLGKYIGMETGPIHVMIMEHEAGRDLYGKFKNMFEAVLSSGDYDNLKDLVSAGNAMVGLLSEHIEKEDQILLNMAEMHLSPKDKEEVGEKI